MAKGFRQPPEAGSSGQSKDTTIEDMAFYTEYTAENTDAIRKDIKDLHDTTEVGVMSQLSTEHENKRQSRYQERLVELAEQIKDSFQLSGGVGQTLTPIPNNVEQIVSILPPEAPPEEALVDLSEETVEVLSQIRDGLDAQGRALRVRNDGLPDRRFRNDQDQDQEEEEEQQPRKKGAKELIANFLKKGIDQLVSHLKKLEIVMKATQALMWAKMNAAMLAVVLGITAIVVGIDLAMVRFKTQIAWIGEKFGELMDWFRAAGDKIAMNFQDAADKAKYLVEAAVATFTGFIDSATQFFEYFKSGQMATDIKNSLSEAWTGVTDKFAAIIDEIKSLFTVFKSNLKITFGEIISKIPGLGETGRAMVAEATDDKIIAQGRSATPEELEQQTAYIQEKYGDIDADEVGMDVRDQYYDDEGKLKSGEGIQRAIKMRYDAQSLDDRAKNIKTEEDREKFNQFHAQVKDDSMSLGTRLWRRYDSTINKEYVNPNIELKPADTTRSQEAAITEDIDQADAAAKIQKEVQKAGDTNAVNVNNSSTQYLYQAPPVTGRNTPGYSSALAVSDY